MTLWNTILSTLTPGVEGVKQPSKQDFARVVALACIITATVGAGVFFAAPAAGQNEQLEPYYNNTTRSDGADSGWFGDGNATLDTVVGMFTRIPAYVIGSGQQDQSGTGYEGVLLTAVIMSGAAIGAIVGTGAGPVGGSVVALSTGFALGRAGLVPPWIRVLMLFGLGIVVAVAFRRAQGP